MLLLLLLLLLSHVSRVRLCATPQTSAHQAPPSLGFSRQEHWSGLPFPSPMHESEKCKWSHSVLSDSDSSGPHGLQPTRLLCPWDFPGKSAGVGCHCLLRLKYAVILICCFLLSCCAFIWDPLLTRQGLFKSLIHVALLRAFKSIIIPIYTEEMEHQEF